jgi:hypothetical protein
VGHLQRVFVGVVVGAQAKTVAVGIQLDVTTQDVSHGVVPGEVGHPQGAGDIGRLVRDEKPAREEKIAGE